ncbi:MAG: lysophospholipid acyltransferase family protein [Parvibaculum sp.]|uniref:lysophospholipid acyltransferase family protein n=1 Tax=Parvibaculum sp. TaxID=2024848 RepID=UPI0032ECA6E8
MTEITPHFSFAAPEDGLLKRRAIRFIEKLTGQPEFVSLYLGNRADPVPGEPFFEAALRLLALGIDHDRERLEAVPKEGPVIFVANHPFGVVDGIIACVLAGRARSDFKILINAVLTQPPEMEGYSLPIDFRETPEALQTNLRARAEARKHLAAGGALLLFPGGTVSTRASLLSGEPAGDPAWKPFVAQLIQRSGATVVPFYFEGENSWAFHAVSHVSATLRLGLLFREVHARMGKTMAVKIGEPIPAYALNGIGDRTAIARHLCRLTYEMGGRDMPVRYGQRLSRRLGLEVEEAAGGEPPRPRLRIAY